GRRGGGSPRSSHARRRARRRPVRPSWARPARPQASLDQTEETLPQTLHRVRVRIELADAGGHLTLAEVALEPAREIVVIRADAQASLEEVIGDGSVGHLPDLLGELGERPGLMGGG